MVPPASIGASRSRPTVSASSLQKAEIEAEIGFVTGDGNPGVQVYGQQMLNPCSPGGATNLAGSSKEQASDGTLVAYDAVALGKQQEHLFIKSSNGIDGERMLPVKRDFGSLVLDHWSSDGRYLLFELFDHSTVIRDLWFMQVAADEQPRVFLRTLFNKIDAQFSPDGRWVAYASDDSGTFEVYVQSFPDPRRKWQVSTNSGKRPRWRRDGRELFYLTASDTLMAVPIDSGTAFSAGTPKALFESPNAGKGIKSRYDVDPGGERFLFDAVAQGATPPAITVVLNWTADTKR